MQMEQNLNVVIVMSRCAHSHGSFGIRVEEQKPGHWAADWAFEVQESVGKREGYDHNEISGSITIAHEYPGCPYCEARGIVLCHCQKVACYDTHSTQSTCPWCGQTGTISNTGITRLQAGSDL